MKKKLYYLMPIVIVPGLLLLLDLFAKMGMTAGFSYIMGAVLVLFSVVVGFLSPTHRTFDYFMTAIMPISLFCLVFILGFLEKDDLGTRFHLHKAVKASTQPIFLQLYCLMAGVTFLTSFKKLRNLRRK